MKENEWYPRREQDMYMSGKETLGSEIPIPPKIEEWANITEMQHDVQTFEDQQELEDSQYVSEKGISVDETHESTPISVDDNFCRRISVREFP